MQSTVNTGDDTLAVPVTSILNQSGTITASSINVAAQVGGYLAQMNSYDETFHNMDAYMLMTKKQRQYLKMKNHYAAADSGLIYDNTVSRRETA